MTLVIDELVTKAISNGTIPSKAYVRHHIKQGLRNRDGSGVKVILTKVADVVGYEKDGGVVPIEGKLLYRGYEIKDLVNGFHSEDRFGFEEVAYLLLAGELPTRDKLMDFSSALGEARNLPPDFVDQRIVPIPSRNIMMKLMRMATSLYDLDENPDDISVENVARQCINLIAKFPAIIAYSWIAKRHMERASPLYIHEPDASHSTAESFLYMIRENREFTDLEAKVLDLMLILHAEHGGGNNSTFTVHTVASTDANTYAVINAGLSSLSGPKHGGANAEVMRMMEAIKDELKEEKPPYKDDKVVETLRKVLRGEIGGPSGLIYGKGHAVYKLTDPRALILKEEAQKLARRAGREPEFDLYLQVEQLAPKAIEKEKGTYVPAATNVDFFSGFAYDCMGLPRDMYTPLFALARNPGWLAHLLELRVNRESSKIIRPAAEYIGKKERPYMPLEQRLAV